MSFVGEINLRELADSKDLSGLSGLTYDEKSDTFFAISDGGHSEIIRFRLDLKVKPPRFERLKGIPLEARNGWNDTQRILPTAPGYIPTHDEIVDLEAITRKSDGSFYLLRESSRGGSPIILHYSPEGKYLGHIDSAPLNETEGLAISPSEKNLWQASEGGVHIDGKDYTDLHHYSACPESQYCRDKAVLYPAEHDVSELVALDDKRLLALERNWDGKMVHAKIGVVDTTKASDIGINIGDWSNRQEVKLPAGFQMASRREIVDLNHLNGFKKVDNLEGMTFGPRLAEGKRSLVLVSDDNANSKQLNQLVILEVPDSLIEVEPPAK